MTGQPENALAVARTYLANQLEDRWGSEKTMLRLLQDAAIASGDYSEALGWFRKLIPECLEQEPLVDSNNIQKAVDLAHLLLLSGEKSQAEVLLNTVVQRYDEMYARGSANYPLGIAKVDALALLGQKPAAIAEMQRVVDDGFRLLWRWETEFNPNQASLRDDPGYTAIMDQLRSDVAAQLEASRTFKPDTVN